MAFIGIDLGSRTAKYVILDQNNSVIAFKIMAGGVNPLEKLRCALQKEGALKERCSQDSVATGYGRHTAQGNLAERTITEIKAFALDAGYSQAGN